MMLNGGNESVYTPLDLRVIDENMKDRESVMVVGGSDGECFSSTSITSKQNAHRCHLLSIGMTFVLLSAVACVYRYGQGLPTDQTSVRYLSSTDPESAAPESPVTPFNNAMNGMMTRVHANDGKEYKVKGRTALQIENYKQSTGLMLNLHITHHGGTTVCRELGRSPTAMGRAPAHACNGEKNMTANTGYNHKNIPWMGKDETARMIPIVRRNFHFIGWEFGFHGLTPKQNLRKVDWENPNLFSILVVRDPISRLLAGSGFVRHNYPSIDKGHGTHDDWWGYANNSWFTNNYALRVLAGDDCCDGANTNRKHLKHAKDLVKRFSVVLDIACLDAGMEAIASLLNITLKSGMIHRDGKSGHLHAPSRERIGYDDVYEYLLAKNKLDIELYEWSKSRALIDCSSLERR